MKVVRLTEVAVYPLVGNCHVRARKDGMDHIVVNRASDPKAMGCRVQVMALVVTMVKTN